MAGWRNRHKGSQIRVCIRQHAPLYSPHVMKAIKGFRSKFYPGIWTPLQMCNGDSAEVDEIRSVSTLAMVHFIVIRDLLDFGMTWNQKAGSAQTSQGITFVPPRLPTVMRSPPIFPPPIDFLRLDFLLPFYSYSISLAPIVTPIVLFIYSQFLDPFNSSLITISNATLW